MTERQRTAQMQLRHIAREIRQQCGYRRTEAIQEIARRFEASELRFDALLIAAERLYSERDRNRTQGLRDGYAVRRNGQIVNVALLAQTFMEARRAVRAEGRNAEGATSRFEWDRYLLGVAEERAREQGYEPDELELVVGTFIDKSEAVALYREWQGTAA